MTEYFARIAASLQQFFALNNIRHKSLSIILNFKDAKEAIDFELYMRSNADISYLGRIGDISIRRFNVCGLDFQLESPVHSAESEL